MTVTFFEVKLEIPWEGKLAFETSKPTVGLYIYSEKFIFLKIWTVVQDEKIKLELIKFPKLERFMVVLLVFISDDRIQVRRERLVSSKLCNCF